MCFLSSILEGFASIPSDFTLWFLKKSGGHHGKTTAWNKGRIIGQKAPLKQQEIWAIRTRLEIVKNTRELALLNLAIDSKLRGCDLVSLKVSDVMRSGEFWRMIRSGTAMNVPQSTNILF